MYFASQLGSWVVCFLFTYANEISLQVRVREPPTVDPSALIELLYRSENYGKWVNIDAKLIKTHYSVQEGHPNLECFPWEI